MSARIESVSARPDALVVDFGAAQRSFSWLWLRDHSQDEESFHPQTKQRLLETFGIGEPSPGEVELDGGGDALVVRWGEGPAPSRFTADFLAAVDAPAGLYDVVAPGRVLWDAESGASLPERHDHAAVASGDEAFKALLGSLSRHGAALVTDSPLDKGGVSAVMERIGYIRATIFGTLFEFGNDGKVDDTASTSLEIKPHTDGTYSHDAPGLQALLCLVYEAEGGENTLVDGLEVARQIREEAPESYEVLCTTPVPGQYIGDGSHLVAQRPPFRTDAAGRIVQVSYNNHDRAPFLLPEPQMSRLYSALALLDRKVNDPANQVSFVLQPGEMIIFDNWRLLHGRKEFSGRRRLAGCYLNREDFESRLRLLSPQPLDMTAAP